MSKQKTPKRLTAFLSLYTRPLWLRHVSAKRLLQADDAKIGRQVVARRSALGVRLDVNPGRARLLLLYPCVRLVGSHGATVKAKRMRTQVPVRMTA
ncbi:hypothetical protein [Sorangium sp. So ce388]|uniref:hypothetical protein n=1 Tax=Sorangium sp. So ce388 TaxID=3133309 RepID=UPI003F5B3278